jgi:hypothetical protein
MANYILEMNQLSLDQVLIHEEYLHSARLP